ncbi:hypothetical protein N303_13751, partial [Cuculus canorus]
VRTLKFRKAEFQLFKDLLGRTLWDTVLRDKRAEQSCQVFNDAFYKVQEHLVLRCRKSGKERKRPLWLSRDLLVRLKRKRELHRQCKQGQGNWEEYRDAAQLCRDGIRKAKAQLELNLARDVKTKMKGFYRYVNQKRKVREGIPQLMDENGDLLSRDEEKVEVLNNFSASVFTDNRSPHPSWVMGQQDGDKGSKAPPTVEECQV